MIEVVEFSARHRAGVVELILSIQQEFDIPITLNDQPDLLDIPGFYQQNRGNFWVALADTRVVGTIALQDIGNAQGALRKMFVQAPFRGSHHGVARCLLDTLLAWCAAKQIGQLYLGTTVQLLAAHRFYEKNGFSEIAKSELPGAFPRVSVDTKFYLRPLRRKEDQSGVAVAS